MNDTTNREKLEACLREIFSELLETGETCGKAIYISEDGDYDVRPQCQYHSDTRECIYADWFLEDAYANIPELAEIKAARDSAWENEHYMEDVADAQKRMYARYNGDKEWLLDDLVKGVADELEGTETIILEEEE